MLAASPLARADPAQPAVERQAYQNFKVAVYVPAADTRRLADPAVFDREFARVANQVRFDKVYVEVHRDEIFVPEDEIERVKLAFQARGIIVEGGVTLARSDPGGQFATFDYEKPEDRALCLRAIRLAVRHFDHVVLDDFFFYNTKSDADIAAKGDRSWTQYRIERMREVARDLVLDPAKAENPRATVTIKYPNWYEHFQGLGFDLDREAQMFGSIYTGTETRDPRITDQLLQPYESYEIIRYYNRVRPGANRGGWVDTFDTRYPDRYAEQLWDTLFAKTPEITLFDWTSMADPLPVKPGERDAWAKLPTSLDWNALKAAYKPTGPDDLGPGWGAVAGYALRHVDKILGALGEPVGIWSYKPYQSSGEDFLPNYLGMVGIPVELSPAFPTDAKTLLLTEAAKADPGIVDKIKGQLRAGKTVFITSGLLGALQARGIGDILEAYPTGRVVGVQDFYGGHGVGAGRNLKDAGGPAPTVLVPDIHFFTNDAWPIIRGIGSSRGYPLLLMNHYSKGTIYVLTIPEDIGDLYNLPKNVITLVKAHLQAGFPVQIDAPAGVSLFVYDNGTFIIESFRAEPTRVNVSVLGEGSKLQDVDTGEIVTSVADRSRNDTGGGGTEEIEHRRPGDERRTIVPLSIAPHSYRVFRTR